MIEIIEAECGHRSEMEPGEGQYRVIFVRGLCSRCAAERKRKVQTNWIESWSDMIDSMPPARQ